VEVITKGEWNSRLASLAKIFGNVPTSILAHVSILEKIRKIRNEFAHGFGRELAVASPSDPETKPIRSLSQQTFVKYIGTISRFAALIDRFLLPGFIGNFELIHYYHEWKLKPKDTRDAQYEPVRAFKRSLHRDLSTPVSTEFCRELIAYYESL
jgi:hypothetical protein